MSAARTREELISRPPGNARTLGPPRSGKTTLLVERFQHLARAGHQPLVIAFGRDQRDRLLERLIPPGTARFGPTPVTTHGLFAARIISTVRPNRARTLRDVDERIVLDRVLTAQPDLLRSDLRSIGDSRTLRDALLQVLHVLAQDGVGADRAEAAARKTNDPRAHDVLRLYPAYQRHLAEKKLVTFYDAAWEAARAVAGDGTLCAAAGVRDVVLVDDFQDLDAGQFALLRAVVPPEGPVALEVFGDPTGSRFSFRGTSERFLIDEFPAAYRPAEFTLPSPRPSDAALAACIALLAHSQGLAPAIGSGSLNSPLLDSLPLFAAAPAHETPQPEWNVNVCAVRASDEVAEAQHAARRVRDWIQQGITPGDIAVVARDPERIASLVHHAFRERGVPIDVGLRADSAVDAFVHALVGALGRDADGRFAEALESSPLLGAFCAARDLPRDVMRAVSTLRAAYSSRGGFDLERLLHDAAAPLANSGAIARVAEEWNRYAEVVVHTGGHPSLDEFRHVYFDVAMGESATGDAPQLVSARAMSGRAVRAAVVLGCADGLFPRVEIGGGYLPIAALASALSRINEGASRDLAARIDRERAEREEMALVLSTLVCAREELCVSHPRKSGDQALTIPPALTPLFGKADDVARDTSAAYRAAAMVGRAPADEALAGTAREIDWMAAGWLRPPGAGRRPVFDELALSPSRLETFTDCERKFFFQRILRIEDPGSIYLTIGSVFHEVLKELLKPDMDGDAVRAALVSDAADEIIERVMDDKMPDAGEWLRALTRVHMHLMLAGVRELETKREGNYRVLSVETSTAVEDDGHAVLTGRVDRIDHVEGLGPVVIDYKTSARLPKTAASILEKIENDRDYWQVVVYAALARSLGHDAKGFVYYVVPPGEEVNAVGLQLAAGRHPAPIPAGGRHSRYDPMPPATLQRVLEDAMKIHADILSGACAYARTDNLEQCGICHFTRVCRRTGE
jgi:hypothetical protein